MVEDKKYMVSESELKDLVGAFCPLTSFDLNRLETFLKSKTPIEPNDDAKKIIAKEVGKEFIHHLVRHLVDNKNRCENFADRLLKKLPQPKPFNEAEIREILYHYKVGNIDAELAVTKFSTLTPKYNSTDRNSIRLNSPEVVKKRRELKKLRDKLSSKDNIKEYIDE